MEFEKLSDLELRYFLASYPKFSPPANLSLVQQAQKLYEQLQKNPNSQYPDFILDLARAAYLKSVFGPSLQQQSPYTPEQIANLTFLDLQYFAQIFGLPPEQVIQPNLQQILRILYFLDLISLFPSSPPPGIFLNTPILTAICQNLTFEEANNFRIAQNLSQLDCTVSISDPDLQISQLYPINSKTFQIKNDISHYGSIESWLLYSDEGNLDWMKLLIRNGFNINSANSKGVTALMIASQNGDHFLVDYLLENGAQVDAKDRNGKTALFLAVKNGWDQIVEKLLNFGADPNQRDQANSTPLFEIIFFLEDSFPKKINRAQRIINLLLTHGADPNATDNDDWNILTTAAGHSNQEILFQALLEAGVDINRISRNGWTALFVAIIRNRFENVKFLVQHGANIDENVQGTFALILAVSFNLSEMVEFLIENGADLNVTNLDGNSSLMNAVKDYRYDLVKLLLEKGADPRIVNQNGQTALDIARELRSNDIAKLIERFSKS